MRGYIAAGAAVLAILVAWGIYRTGYTAGEAKCQAQMQSRVEAANLRATETEVAAEARVQSLEKYHETKFSGLDDRYRAAVARLERLRAAARSSQVPAASVNAAGDSGHTDRPGHAGTDDSDTGALILYARNTEQLRLALQLCKGYGAEIERFKASIQ